MQLFCQRRSIVTRQPKTMLCCQLHQTVEEKQSGCFQALPPHTHTRARVHARMHTLLFRGCIRCSHAFNSRPAYTLMHGCTHACCPQFPLQSLLDCCQNIHPSISHSSSVKSELRCFFAQPNCTFCHFTVNSTLKKMTK